MERRQKQRDGRAGVGRGSREELEVGGKGNGRNRQGGSQEVVYGERQEAKRLEDNAKSDVDAPRSPLARQQVRRDGIASASAQLAAMDASITKTTSGSP